MLRIWAVLCALAGPATAQDVHIVPYDDSYPPLSFVKEGEADGFDVAVAKALAEIIEVDIRFEATSFDEIQQGDWPEGWIFAVSSMSKNSARNEKFNFVGPYYYETAVFVRRTDEVPFVESDLVNARVGICNGCIYEAFLTGNVQSSDANAGNRFEGISIVKYATDTDVLTKLTEVGPDGEPLLDFGVTSALAADHFMRGGFAIEQVGAPLYVQPVWIVVPKDDIALTERLETAYLTLQETGRIGDLSVQFLGRNYADLSQLGIN